MAASFQIIKKRPEAREVIVDMTCDASYPAGGYPVTPANLGLLSVPEAVVAYERTVQGNDVQFDHTNQKVKIFQTGAARSGVFSEAVNTDLTTADIIRLVCKGDVVL